MNIYRNPLFYGILSGSLTYIYTTYYILNKYNIVYSTVILIASIIISTIIINNSDINNIELTTLSPLIDTYSKTTKNITIPTSLDQIPDIFIKLNK